VNVFSKYILNCEVADDWNEPMANYVINLLLDHYNDVLQVPSTLVNQVSAKLHEKRSSRTQQRRVCVSKHRSVYSDY